MFPGRSSRLHLMQYTLGRPRLRLTNSVSFQDSVYPVEQKHFLRATRVSHRIILILPLESFHFLRRIPSPCSSIPGLSWLHAQQRDLQDNHNFIIWECLHHFSNPTTEDKCIWTCPETTIPLQHLAVTPSKITPLSGPKRNLSFLRTCCCSHS